MKHFSWFKLVGSCPHTNGCGGPGRMLLREMLWQLERRVLQVQEEEFQYCISRGILGYRHPPAYPSLLALIPASEHRQLERLCGRIPPSHTAIVLSRLHDLLAHNDIPPWELVGVFKQVLRDFLRRQEDGIQRRPAPSESGKHREEIPTISSYVDKHLRAACPYSIHRDWSLPFCHPFTYEAYGTTL
uniref:Si:ch211-253p18.5 n=1 Tax=Cyprinus carpio TaxID=7962 RepID=A0A8C1JGT8_CYPCA